MRVKIIAAILFFQLKSFSQESLTVSQAIELSLKNNLQISIAKKNVEISEIKNTVGNAGMLPTLTFNSSLSKSNNNTNQEFNNGASINRQGASSSIINSGLALNYTIFDGFSMFAEKSRLEELEAQQNFNLKNEIENVISNTITLYYSIVKQEQLINAGKEGIKILEERLKIIENKINLGSASEQELLQTKIEFNNQKSQILKEINKLEGLKSDLNLLLNVIPEKEFSFETDIPINTNIQINELSKEIKKSNYQLLFTEKNIDIAKSNIKKYNGANLPKVNFNTSYNFSQTKNEVGLILLNRNLGVNAALSASWNLFDGFKNKASIQSSKVSFLQSKLLYEQLELAISSSVYKAFKTYKNNLSILELENQNQILVNQNIYMAMEKFKLGKLNSIELMIAQKNLLDAQTNLINAKFETKMAETSLLKLSGKLLK